MSDERPDLSKRPDDDGRSADPSTSNPYLSKQPPPAYGAPAEPTAPYAGGYPSPPYPGQPGQPPVPGPYGAGLHGASPYGANPYGANPYGAFHAVPDHPQATTALVLGVLSIMLCQLVGPFAWSVGAKARREIDADPRRWGGRSQATVGYVLGIVSTVLLAVAVVVVVLLVVVAATTTPS